MVQFEYNNVNMIITLTLLRSSVTYSDIPKLYPKAQCSPSIEKACPIREFPSYVSVQAYTYVSLAGKLPEKHVVVFLISGFPLIFCVFVDIF